MKQFFNIAKLAIFLFPSLLSANNPTTLKAEDLAINMVEYIHNDVKLISSQQETLKKAALIYYTNLIQATTMDNKEQSYEMMKSVTINFETSLDSILTNNQKKIKLKNEQLRIAETLKKYNINY